MPLSGSTAAPDLPIPDRGRAGQQQAAATDEISFNALDNIDEIADTTDKIENSAKGEQAAGREVNRKATLSRAPHPRVSGSRNRLRLLYKSPHRSSWASAKTARPGV